MAERRDEQSGPGRSKRQAAPPVWERVVAFLGLLLVLASLGYLLYQGIWGNRSPPDIVIAQETIASSGKDYLVQFRARNLGGETAAEVKITGTLSRNGQEIEKSEVTIDYVAAGSERRGGLFFSNDPRDGQFALSVSGYRLP
jgi:uncharacterized protein (TIGR02588 family)